MLSRVADNLYWMSRYLERAEHTARLVDQHLNLTLDQTPDGASRGWDRVLSCVRTPAPAKDYGYAISRRLTVDRSNHSSVVSCIAAARDNARNVREQISAEMWEHLNRLYLHLGDFPLDSPRMNPPRSFFDAINDATRMFEGITDSTMNHGEGWQLIQLGRFLERATSMAITLDVYFCELFVDDNTDQNESYMDWMGLLRACSALESYCKVYTADLQPGRIAEFLLLNPQFPHSVCFASEIIEEALNGIASDTGSQKSARVTRLAGRLRADLSYGQIDEVLESGLHKYLDQIQSECSQIHTAFHQIYIAYPVAEALAA